MTQAWNLEISEERFQRVHSDWIACEQAEAREWEESFQRLWHEQAALVEAGDWVSGRADLLGILGRGRRELDHSAIVAWFLDPRRPHGFRTRFLDRFLARAIGEHGLSLEELAHARTECEVPRSQSRADIVVRLPSRSIIIEMKVDAGEGWEQCRRLVEDWDLDGKQIFIFLAPARYERPTTDTRDRFVFLSFETVREILEETAIEPAVGSAKPTGRAVALTYLATLDKEFP